MTGRGSSIRRWGVAWGSEHKAGGRGQLQFRAVGRGQGHAYTQVVRGLGVRAVYRGQLQVRAVDRGQGAESRMLACLRTGGVGFMVLSLT